MKNEKKSVADENGMTAQAACVNDVSRVYFRAGLLAARESLARFVESESPTIAGSIRANWWPRLGPDPGPPRKLNFNEIADGGEEGPWNAKQDIDPSVEALPVALGFISAGDGQVTVSEVRG